MNVADQLRTALAARYEIEGEIGVGGMATVYRAVDLRHHRKVAVKVLHPELAAILGSERFLKEIELTAGLQHPHILPLFDSGEAEGLLYYVMPYVEGESLRARLERERQLPVTDALRIGSQVADALDYAHRHGLVHRDVKPENILLHEGSALVMDFGIALAIQSAGEGRMTQTGLSLGTPQYMAPEQAMGERGVDARADVYALGAVVYEMLAGEAPFTGPSSPAVLAKVLTERPREIRINRPQVPEQVDAAVIRALEKLPADRWQSAKEFSEALQGSGGSVFRSTVHPAAAASSGRRGATVRQQLRQPLTIGLGAAALGLSAAVLVLARSWGSNSNGNREMEAVPVALEISIPGSEGNFDLNANTYRLVAISPDSRMYAFHVLGADGVSRIYLRRSSETVARPLPGSEGAWEPTFSPGGRSLAYISGGALWRTEVDGGARVRIGDVEDPRDPTWVGDHIAYRHSSGRGIGFMRANGGPHIELTVADSAGGELHRSPVGTNDGETVLFQSYRGSNVSNARVGIASLRTGEWKVFDELPGVPLGVLEGLLIYHDGTSTIFGVPFDIRSWQLTGTRIALLQDVTVHPSSGGRAALAALSSSGTLIYASGIGQGARELTAVDFDGSQRPLSPLRGVFRQARYSPDGRQVALTIEEGGTREIWLHHLSSGTLQRLGADGERPEWTPDGEKLLYLVRDFDSPAVSINSPAVWILNIDGSRPPERLQEGAAHGIYSPDGTELLYRAGGPGPAGNNLFVRSLTGDTTSRPLAVSSAYEHSNPAVSPDGRWVAYPSNESGTWQIYVQPYPGPGRRFPISVAGGDHAVWAPDGSRLYYSSGNRMMEARITQGPFEVSRRLLYTMEFHIANRLYREWDLAPDGSHFLFTRPVEDEEPIRVFVIHIWRADVRARIAGQ
jgi:eukaryotic-like serine/threonine-protein kinase